MSSPTAGGVFTGTPASRQSLTMRWRVSTRGGGIAMITSSSRLSASRCRNSLVVPSTRMPFKRMFFLRGSSSTRPIGV